MIKIIKHSFDFYVIQDDARIEQFCVMVKTEYGFSQQISRWYFRRGYAIKAYNKILREHTRKILDRKELIL